MSICFEAAKMWNLHQFWATQRPAAASAAWNARDQDLHFLLHDLITRRRLGRSAELLAYNADVLNVFHEDPSKMYAKIWAIEQDSWLFSEILLAFQLF